MVVSTETAKKLPLRSEGEGAVHVALLSRRLVTPTHLQNKSTHLTRSLPISATLHLLPRPSTHTTIATMLIRIMIPIAPQATPIVAPLQAPRLLHRADMKRPEVVVLVLVQIDGPGAPAGHDVVPLVLVVGVLRVPHGAEHDSAVVRLHDATCEGEEGAMRVELFAMQAKRECVWKRPSRTGVPQSHHSC